jgi:hypothetical protein
MRIVGIAVSVLATSAGILVPSAATGATPTQGDCSTDGGFGDDEFNLGGECPGAEEPVVGPVASSSSGPTAYWQRNYVVPLPADLEARIAQHECYVTPPAPGAPPCQAPPAWICRTGDDRVGILYRDDLHDGRTGAIVAILAEPVDIAGVPPGTFYGWTGCVALEDLIADPLAGQPPAPPTVEEAWAQVPIEPAVIGASPDVGVTGMDTWLWADDPGTLGAGPVDLRGWEIEGQAQIEEWTWSGEDGDDAWSVSSASAGSEQDPAGEHMYDVKGDYEIAVARAWTGSYTVTGYGITYTVDDLTYEDEATVPYDVDEIVAVVDEPDDD